MKIIGLGYLVIESTEAEHWPGFARDVLGMEAAVDADGTVVLRVDERAARIVIVPAERNALQGVGLEVTGGLAWEAAVDELRAAGAEVSTDTGAQARRARVTGLARVSDPSGNPLEIFHGPLIVTSPLDRPGGPRYKTGELGLGHVVVPAVKLDETFRFYVETLGFGHRDTIRPMLNYPDPLILQFLGCNRRHHTVALASQPDPRGMRHFMLEVESIAEVGRTYDRCRERGLLMTHLGQHSNDQGLSFYIRCPGGLMLEFGTACIEVDGATWSARELDAAGFWGHQLVSS
jgi:3,4-dihydroxy-9,10-secoandrosta-1,3,5(10)-triene-9,17-dione 4,5-dioxygenase